MCPAGTVAAMDLPLVHGWRCCAYHAPRQRAEVQPMHLCGRCAPISTAGSGSCATAAPWSCSAWQAVPCEPAEARTALPAWECRQGRMQRCQCAPTGSGADQMPSGSAIDAAVQLTHSCPSRACASDALLARQPSGPEKVQALAKGHERSLWSDRKVAGKRQRRGRGWLASTPRRFRWQLLCLPSMVPASQCLLARGALAAHRSGAAA